MAKCPHCGEAYPDTAYYRGRLKQHAVVAHYETCDEYARNAETGRLVVQLGKVGQQFNLSARLTMGGIRWRCNGEPGDTAAEALRAAAAKLGIETGGETDEPVQA